MIIFVFTFAFTTLNLMCRLDFKIILFTIFVYPEWKDIIKINYIKLDLLFFFFKELCGLTARA